MPARFGRTSAGHLRPYADWRRSSKMGGWRNPPGASHILPEPTSGNLIGLSEFAMQIA